MHHGYLILDRPRPGSDNMAIDHALLETAGREGCAFLRIYQWQQPTISLGYFQNYAEREEHRESSKLDIVRRSTGGGAIVHDHDWTYSVCIPNALLDSTIGAVPDLYEAIHSAVIQWLAKQGVHASQVAESACSSVPDSAEGCSFLCFERRSPGDVVSQGHKILGSAQRRKHGALLQHGSLLLRQSESAPSLKGLAEIIEEISPPAGQPEASTGGRQPDFDKLSADATGFSQSLKNAMEDFCQIRFENATKMQQFVPEPVNQGIFSQDSWLYRR